MLLSCCLPTAPGAFIEGNAAAASSEHVYVLSQQSCNERFRFDQTRRVGKRCVDEDVTRVDRAIRRFRKHAGIRIRHRQMRVPLFLRRYRDVARKSSQKLVQLPIRDRASAQEIAGMQRIRRSEFGSAEPDAPVECQIRSPRIALVQPAYAASECDEY